MKSLSLFTSLFIALSVISTDSYGVECSPLFSKEILPTKVRKESAGDVLLSVFDLILKAPANSKVKIFSNNLRTDGIASLLVMTSVSEARRGRGLKFEFNIENRIPEMRLHDLIVESSSNTLRFKKSEELNESSENLSQKTLVVVESAKGSSFISFNADLVANSLKIPSQKRSIPLDYYERYSLRASPFRENIEVKRGTLTEAMKSVVTEMGTEYGIKHQVSPQSMRESELESMGMRGFDLALQLYIHKNGKAPKELLNTMGILGAAVATPESSN